MERLFSNKVKEVISLSREEAIRLFNDFIGVEHLLLGIIKHGDNFALDIIKSLNAPIEELKLKIEIALKRHTVTSTVSGSIPLTKETEKTLKLTYTEAGVINDSLGRKYNVIGTESLILAFLKVGNKNLDSILPTYDLSYKRLLEAILFYYSGKTNEEVYYGESFAGHDPEQTEPYQLKPELKLSTGRFEGNDINIDLIEPKSSDRPVLLLEFEIPDNVSDEEALKLIKEGVLLMDETHRDLGGNGLKINDVRVTEFQPELVPQNS